MKVPEAIRTLGGEILREGGEREMLLRAKCRWEQMTRSAVLMRYGDPAAWSLSKKSYEGFLTWPTE